jgi:leucine dehydrogenase
MTPFDAPEFADHEHVSFFTDERTGLRAIVAVHSTALGPAAGGCRLWPYPSTDAALTDVLRLSAAMTWKNALAGLPLGGGKSVVIADPSRRTPELLAAFAGCVERLGGRYWTAEDVGVGIDEVEALARHTRYVFGLQNSGQKTGDPSPFTARGTFLGLRAAVRHRLGREELDGLRVAVQGVGHVGFELCRQLHEAGAKLTVADTNPAAVARAETAFGAIVVPAASIQDTDVDVYSPCALGGTVDADTPDRLRARVIAGAANNQLAHSAIGDALRARGIVYAPDFVINAGGMLNAGCDILGSYDREEVLRRIDLIHDRTLEVLARADRDDVSTEAAALAMAHERLRTAARAPR